MKTAMSTKDASLVQFTKDVFEYRRVISKNYYGERGDEEDRNPYKAKIIKLFKKHPELKIEFLYIVSRNLSRQVKTPREDATTRLNYWLQELTEELLDELESIKTEQ